MRKRCRFTSVLLCGIFIVTLCGCYPETEINTTLSPPPVLTEYKWSDDISLPIPAPRASIAMSGNGVYKDCDGSIHFEGVTKKDLTAYLNLLKSESFKLFIRDYADFFLLRGNESIYILDQSFLLEQEGLTPFIDITYDAGYQGSYTDGRMAKGEAKKLIQDYIDEMSVKEPDYYSSYTVEQLAEIEAGDAFEKMGLQAYEVYDAEGPEGDYIICSGSVTDAFKFGQTVTADIDKDGEYEFLNIIGFGSGIYRIVIDAYKYGVPPGSSDKGLFIAYSSTLIPDDDASPYLKLVKTSDNEVYLYSSEGYDLDFKLITNYGVLQPGGNGLYVSASNFPYKKWEDVYDD